MVAATRAPSSISEAIVLRMHPVIDMSEDDFFDFCQLNSEWVIERTADGELEIMSPAGWNSGSINSNITAQLQTWATRDGTGTATDSSAGYRLPNSAVRAPDAAWIRNDRVAMTTPQQQERFLPLCPDFVIELRSPSDSIPVLQGKMEEYQANGARLGWLIDPVGRHLHVYRLGQQPEIHESPDSVGGDPVLPGFVLDLRPVWTR